MFLTAEVDGFWKMMGEAAAMVGVLAEGAVDEETEAMIGRTAGDDAI